MSCCISPFWRIGLAKYITCVLFQLFFLSFFFWGFLWDFFCIFQIFQKSFLGNGNETCCCCCFSATNSIPRIEDDDNAFLFQDHFLLATSTHVSLHVCNGGKGHLQTHKLLGKKCPLKMPAWITGQNNIKRGHGK